MENSKDVKSNKMPIDARTPPFYSMIKWSFVFACITTYTHFFGFSFVKGKLQGAGFYSSDISLDVNETLHEAAAATQVGLYSIAKHFFSAENFQTALVLAISLPLGFLIAIYLPSWIKCFGYLRQGRTELQGRFYDVAKKMLVSVLLGGVGFVLPYLVTLVMVFLVSIVWLGMSIGQSLGETHTQTLIESKVCQSLSEAKHDIVRGCMAIQLADDSVLFGRILHQETSKLFFLTNNGSYLLNEKLEIQYSSCVHRVDEGKNSSLGIATQCMARCEPVCQKKIEEIKLPK